MDKLKENKNNIIIIITKDKPTILKKTLDSIDNVSFSKYVIDDSFNDRNILHNRQIIQKFSNCYYIGLNDYKKFIKKHNIDIHTFSFLIRPLGRNNWNLGYVRNFALLFAKSLKCEKVLFMDEDITVPKISIIINLFNLVDSYSFVGANISGLVDDSILGHIATEIGIENERMISGGFMVFKPDRIDQYFLNIYNEDWIWLFLQVKGKKFLQTEVVFQEVSNPIVKYKSIGKFQEFGEIALDGILDLYKTGRYSTLMKLDFWDRIVMERKEYINLMLKRTVEKDKILYSEIISWIDSNSLDLTPMNFHTLFEKYFINRKIFISLYNSL